MKAAISEITKEEDKFESPGLTADENNLLHQMWNKIELEEEFC